MQNEVHVTLVVGPVGKVDDKVCAVVKAKMGYEDFEEIMRIENALFEGIEVKN